MDREEEEGGRRVVEARVLVEELDESAARGGTGAAVPWRPPVEMCAVCLDRTIA